MAAFEPSVPPGTAAPAGASTESWADLAKNYDSEPVRPPRLWPMATLFGILGLTGLGAQAFGLTSISEFATMRAQADGLAQDRTRLTGEVSTLRGERGQIDGELEARRSALAQLEERHTKAERELDLAQKNRAVAEDSFAQLQEAQRQAQAKTSAAAERLKELATAIAQSTSELESLGQSETALKKIVSEMEATRGTLEATLEALGKATKSLTETEKQKRSAYDELTQLQERSKKLAEDNSAAEARRANTAKTSVDIAELEAKKSSLEKQVGTLTATEAAARMTQSQLQMTIDENRRLLAQQEGTLARLRTDYEQVAPKVKELAEKEASLRDQAASLDAAVSERTGKLRSVELQMGEAERQANLKAADLATTISTLAAKMKDLDQVRSDIDRLAPRVQQLKDEESSLRQQLGGSDTAIAARSTKLRTLEQQQADAQADLAKKGAEAAAATANRDSLRKDIERLQSEQAAARQALELLAAEKARLTEDRDQLKTDVAEAQARVQAHDSRKARLEQQEEVLTSGFVDLIATLKKAVEDIKNTAKGEGK